MLFAWTRIFDLAKLTEHDKILILADYHTGKYSQRDLAKKHNVSLGTVSKITKEVEPKNEHIVNAQIAVLSAKSILSVEEMNAIMNTANEEIFNSGIITNATQLNVVRMMQHITENKKLEKVSIGLGIQSFQEVGLGSGDYLNIQNAIDKASITLKVSDRHAPKQDINLTNAQQNNEMKTINVTYE